MGYASDDAHFQRLTEVCEACYTDQRVDRKIHQFIVRHLLGEYHPAVADEEAIETSIPLLSMAFRAMARHLISKSPAAMVNIPDPTLKAWAETGEQALNRRIKQSKLDAELRECVGQSMASFGIMFMGPQYVGTPSGMQLDLVMQAIDRSKFFYDTRSATLEYSDLCGHEFDMPLVDIHENPMFDEDCRGEVDANGSTDTPRDETTNLRERRTSSFRDLYDYATIRCVYERRRNKLIYYPRHQPQLKLAEMEFQGPRVGPYRFLYYEKVPGNALPVSPLMHLLKKHRAFNVLDVRSIHQQEVQKALLAYTNASKNEAETVLNSTDLQSVLMENGNLRWLHIGGAAADLVAMGQKQQKDFSYASSGIIDQFLSQADTLGQERLLRGATNEFLDDMAGFAYQFVKGITEDIFFYELRDPSDEVQSFRRPIEGTDLDYPVFWTYQHRQVALEMEDQFAIDVEPYSYVERSPQSRLADLLGALQIMMGMGDQMMAQGITIDIEAVARAVAKYKNLPELYDVLILNQDPMKLAELLGPRRPGATGGSTAGKPNGRYTRESESDGSGEAVEIIRSMGRRQNEAQVA